MHPTGAPRAPLPVHLVHPEASNEASKKNARVRERAKGARSVRSLDELRGQYHERWREVMLEHGGSHVAADEWLKREAAEGRLA